MNKTGKKRKKGYVGESILSYFIRDEKYKAPAKTVNPCNISTSLPVSKSNPLEKTPRKCPFYKWIPDTSFTVDAFCYAEIPGCTCYFLSHFHFDHFRGIHKNFKGDIYCSEVTKNLLRNAYGLGLVINVLEIEKSTKIGDVEVTALDANHCPGSLMFLFYVPSKQKTYLHTGDFRYTPSMLTHPSILTNYLSDDSSSKKLPRIHSIFLDTTYCSSQYDFPTQLDVIHGALEVTRDYLIKDPTILVVCGMYSIGKERFTLGLASKLNLKVWLPNNQNRLIKLAAQGGCTICKELLQYVVDSSHKAQLHVLPMQQLNVTSLVEYQKKLGNRLPIDPFHSSSTLSKSRFILGWRPTGWSHRQSNNTQTSMKPPRNGIVLEQKKGDIHIYGASYSEHSSFLELKQFITRLHPVQVQPTVFGKSITMTKDTVNSWLK
ncbi:unnamed protein product [Schistosoma margrebowiei]|uniref:Uncharacterized protein n=1 Tax=Schistosoma margrebowiei TaxID=48269 RepID=A0A183MQG9_9TREM|nr:unnamed protein product [Schistosoma margrebowiei]